MTTTYSTPGTYSYTVPAGVTALSVDLASGQGGSFSNTYNGSAHVALGGKGGRIQAVVAVTPGETLTFYVGSAGASADDGTQSGYSSSKAGGSGGATGGAGAVSGGGTSELRRGSTRLLVAGAGGAAALDTYGAPTGGYGGGSGAGRAGQTDNAPVAQPGTATAGGAGGGSTATAGTANSGGAGAGSSSTASGGGGGGGWFGGGGGNNTGSGAGTQASPYTPGAGGGAGGSGHADSSATNVVGTDNYQSGNGYFAIVNSPPNAPTPTSPTGNPTINRLQPYQFAATFSDPDVGDTPSRFWMRYRSSTASPTPAWTVLSQTGTSQMYTTAGSYFAADHYEFQFAYQDSQGVPSDTTALAWSASTFAYFATPTNAPTITSPTNGAAIGTSSCTVGFSQPTLDQFRYYVTDAAGNSLVGLTTVTDPTAVAARQFTITGLANNTDIKIFVATHDSNGWTSYAESDNPVSYTPPSVTTLTLTPANTPPTLTTTYTTAPGSSSVSATTSVLVEYSRDAGLTVEHNSTVQTANGTDTYLTPAGDQNGGISYAARITATADNGTSTTTGWVT